MKKFNCIIIIDDHPADLYFQTYIIKEANICNHLETLYDYRDALSFIADPEKPHPDVIFVDISTTRVNGIKFLQRFRELDDKIRSGISLIILLNEYEPEAMKIAADTHEVKRFIHKPLTFEVLDEIINELL
jgi:DNA-binding NarL/FixJ family response regulator